MTIQVGYSEINPEADTKRSWGNRSSDDVWKESEGCAKMQRLLTRLGALSRRPKARESLKIPPLKYTVAGFEVMEPVTSMAGFGLELTSVFVLPL